MLFTMPRGLAHYQQCGCFHFLTFSCYHRRSHLQTAAACQRFESALERVRSRYRLVVAGFVVMPEHVHLLVSEPQQGTLATAIQALKLSVARRSAQRPFSQARYYDFNVYSAVKVTEKLDYMHRNPVNRGLVERPEDWLWSSYRHYATGARGTVEIESRWTAARRGYKLPAGFEVRRLAD